jgi:hypothetical protein
MEPDRTPLVQCDQQDVGGLSVALVRGGVGYIQETRTQTGLTVDAYLVTWRSATGVQVPDAVIATLDIRAHEVGKTMLNRGLSSDP